MHEHVAHTGASRAAVTSGVVDVGCVLEGGEKATLVLKRTPRSKKHTHTHKAAVKGGFQIQTSKGGAQEAFNSKAERMEYASPLSALSLSLSLSSFRRSFSLACHTLLSLG